MDRLLKTRLVAIVLDRLVARNDRRAGLLPLSLGACAVTPSVLRAARHGAPDRWKARGLRGKVRETQMINFP
jgi:hypothetical protein